MVGLLVKSTLETRLSWYVKSGPTSKGFCRTLLNPEELPSEIAAHGQNVQTGRLGAKHARKTSVPPRFGVCAPEPRPLLRLRGARRRSPRLALVPPVLRVHERVEKIRREAPKSRSHRYAIRVSRKSGITGTSLANWTSARFRTRACCTASNDPLRLIESGCNQSLTVTRCSSEPLRSRRWTSPRDPGQPIPGEERNVERAAWKNLFEDAPVAEQRPGTTSTPTGWSCAWTSSTTRAPIATGNDRSHEAERESFARAGIDAVGPLADIPRARAAYAPPRGGSDIDPSSTDSERLVVG